MRRWRHTMKYLICVLLAVTACASAPVRPPPPAAREPASVRELHHLAVGRLPHFQLREIALGATMDVIVRGSTPGSSGLVLCSTGNGTAAFESAATCGLATGTNAWSLATTILSETTGQ